jgi:hypothetical protein
MSSYTRTPEYEAYHQRVVDACVARTTEEMRHFFDVECDYLEEFAADEDPDDVATAQIEAMDGE